MPTQEIQRYVQDSLTRPLPDLTPRDVSLPAIPNKAAVAIGMRRSGKTYLLFQEMRRLLAQGIERRHLFYINFEDDRLGPLGPRDLGHVLESFFRESPEARTQGAHLFLDEVQQVEGWGRFARRVLDTEKARLYVSGSSAKMLSTEVATEFRGRGFAIEVLPFSFAEAVRHGGVALPRHAPGAALRSRLEALLLRYLEVGGFPEVQAMEAPLRIGMLQDYVELVVVRDVIGRHGVTNVHAARAYARAALQATGRPFSVNKTCKDFTSRGIRVGKEMLYALLAHFTDAFLVFAVPVFSKSLRVREANPRKIYLIDPGLAYATSPMGTSNLGARLETAVYLALRRRLDRPREGAISYGSTQEGFEVDFVVGQPDDEHALELVQVCADFSQTETRARELRALSAAMTEWGLAEATVVTLHDDEIVKTRAGRIRVVPAWRWMLGME